MKQPRPSAPGAELWAWLFVHASELGEVRFDLASGPYGAALELANQTKFSMVELQSYEKARDEIRQVLEIADARWVEGKTQGKVEGKAETLLGVRSARGLAVRGDAFARIQACRDPATLDRWIVGAITAASVDERF